MTPADQIRELSDRARRVLDRIKAQGKRKLFSRRALTVCSMLVPAAFLAMRGVSYKDLTIVLATVTLGVVVFNGANGIYSGFVLWVLTLALGYRTVEWTPALRIHPSEVLLWLLLACICIHRDLRAKSRLMLPTWLLLMIPFWLLGWWPLILGTASWDQMLNEFRNFVLVVPLMIVATVVLQHDRNWRRLFLSFFAAGSWIAGMGVLEYFVPRASSLFSSFMTVANAGTTEGFERASFSFWGGPMATFVCALTLPIAIVALNYWQAVWQRLLIIAAALTHVVAIYIGGYRSIWITIAIEIGLACLLSLKRQRVAVTAICLVIMIGGYQLLPEAGQHRALTGIEALRGRPTDSSARQRMDRAQGAFDKLLAAPLGNGWSAAGWVHSDFLQVAANLGLFGGLIFLGGFIHTFSRLFRIVALEPRSSGDTNVGIALLLSFFSAGGILATQGVEVLPQLILPVWFVWVLVEVWLVQLVAAREAGDAAAINSGAANLTDDWWPRPLAGVVTAGKDKWSL